jgi:cytochrome c oxidase subunit 3
VGDCHHQGCVGIDLLHARQPRFPAGRGGALMETTHTTTHPYAEKLATNRLGLWLFFVSDAFVFGALLVTRYYLLGGRRPHLEQGLGLLVTSVLLVSSFFMNRAEVQISRGNQKAFVNNTLITMLLGIVFLVGVIGFEWRLAPFGPADGPEGAVFYMMTGMHAFHVLTGVIFLFIIYRNGRNGKFSAEKHWGVEAAANYWHFVDLVWIFFYPALYLIGVV